MQYEYENHLQFHVKHTYKQDDYRYYSRLKKTYFFQIKQTLNYAELVNLFLKLWVIISFFCFDVGSATTISDFFANFPP